MEGDERDTMLACIISGTLFSVLGSGSFAILWAVNWRPWRIYSWIFARKWPNFLQGPQLGILCGLLSLLAWIVVISPVLVLIIWGCWLILILGRDIIGLAVIMAGTALLLAFYSIMLWWRTQWQSSRAIAVLLLLAVALLCAYEICAVYVTAGRSASERYSASGFFFGMSAIALAINMLFICRMVFNGNGLDVDEYVRRAYKFAYSDCIEVGPLASLPEPPDPNELYPRQSRRASHLGLLYFGSLLVLLVYSILYGLTAKSSHWLGAITSAAVIILDWNMGACLYGFQLLQSRVAALFVAGASRVFLICFGVHYWYLGHCVSYAVVASVLLGAAVSRHLSVTNPITARRDALQSTVIRLREGFRRKEQNSSSSSSEACGSSVKRSSSAEAGQLGNAAHVTGDASSWNIVEGINSEKSVDSGRPSLAIRSSSCRSVVQETEVGTSYADRNFEPNCSLVVCSSSGLESQGCESNESTSANQQALDLNLALMFQEKLNDPRITSMLKKRARQGDIDLTTLLQDKGLDPNFAMMLKENGLDPRILALLQRSSLDADRDHCDNTNITIVDSNSIDNTLPNQISLSEELRLQGLEKWLQFCRLVLHHIVGTPERAWVLFSFIFIIETVIVAIFRPKTIKVINATHQQFEFGFAVLLLSPVVCSIMAFLRSLQAEEMAMTSKPRKYGFIAWLLSTSVGLLLSFLSKSSVLLGVSLTVPLIVACLSIGIPIWIRNGYQFWVSRVDCADHAGTHRTLWLKEGVVLFVCISIFTGSVLALGAIVSAKPLDELGYKGWNGDQNSGTSPYESSVYLGWAMACVVGSSLNPSGRMRQSRLVEHLQSAGGPKRSKPTPESDELVSGSEFLVRPVETMNESSSLVDSNPKSTTAMSTIGSIYRQEEDIGPEWEQRCKTLLHKHFGYSSLKSFQKEALTAWLAHQDCLVLSATGSGKSLCFQIPALLTGKVVVVISPLISLMHDQCMKLAKHGVSACFLGSGQVDRSVEEKAMGGMYGIIYICPETVLRLIKPLQGLAESRGIALFAIDEVHCVSKWGHDFRPDYRRLSVLRENFRANNLKSLKFDIPLMALTATATTQVREDILKSLHMSDETKIVLTSFFRPNLRFSVKHSKTTSPSSYENAFCELINMYTRKKKFDITQNVISKDLEDASDNSSSTSSGSTSETEGTDNNSLDNIVYDAFSGNNDEVRLQKENSSYASKEKKMSVEYLEDECDLFRDVDDLDVSCGEFFGLPTKACDACGVSDTTDLPKRPEERPEILQGSLEHGPSIIYAPTRKETLSISKFLCRFGVKAAAYNAKLPKSHLRQVHKEFHENVLEVVVATIAFGMGIDKSNVRRIIHYGWPQSLEAYFQEAGRAGRDGKLADCVLYADLSKIPTLLPSQRSEEQTKQAYRMLSDCFRYGMYTSCCRAKTLVQYFGEEFSYEKCLLCDVCVNGPPEMQNLKAEAEIFMQAIAAQNAQGSFVDDPYDDSLYSHNKLRRYMGKPSLKIIVSRIREKFQTYAASDLLWWRGLARILEDKGFIREGADMLRVQIKFPEPTQLGMEFLRSKLERPFYVYPEADMLLSMKTDRSYSTFAEWGKGWADPEIRRQRLERRRSCRKPRKRKSRKVKADLSTVRGRLASKLSKQK